MMPNPAGSLPNAEMTGLGLFPPTLPSSHPSASRTGEFAMRRILSLTLFAMWICYATGLKSVPMPTKANSASLFDHSKLKSSDVNNATFSTSGKHHRAQIRHDSTSSQQLPRRDTTENAHPKSSHRPRFSPDMQRNRQTSVEEERQRKSSSEKRSSNFDFLASSNSARFTKSPGDARPESRKSPSSGFVKSVSWQLIFLIFDYACDAWI